MMDIRDPALEGVAAKLADGRRLDAQDGLAMLATPDIHALGELADGVKRQLHGDRAYYILNRHINYTNVCVLRCRFCSFCRRAGQADAYTLTVEEATRQAAEAYQAGATEAHIVGGLHPSLPFDYYVDLCRSIRSACPGMHIKAFTAIEIHHFARMAGNGMTIEGVLERLREAGLDSLPGGGAEIFAGRVHDEAFAGKVGADGWFAVHRAAHRMGMSTTATMLFGHIETPAERIEHLLTLRAHQDRSLAEGKGRFTCLVPLPFIPAGSGLSHLPGPSGVDQLRTLAACRLMLDNVAHIKAFWVMLTPKLAQVSLAWGVDDLDGTVEQ
mgnify:CR=1 FL=1